MLGKTFQHNKKVYLAYNNFRKKIFTELAPRDAQSILYLLPWLLSVNDPAVPGYVPNLEESLAVFGAATDMALLKEEPFFKTLFRIRKSGSLLKNAAPAALIQGLYTIGSVGTISQTATSDCDIWICIKKADFNERSQEQLLQKINLIKDWMDANLKMPVYFFLCDLEDIRNSSFGVLGNESSGSAQRNVLKEEFYRTSILICGKIPLWWACYCPGEDVDYQAFAAQYAKDAFCDYDFIDMGELESVDKEEYFGAALWQFNKALTHPLKSLIKMLLLEMLLGSKAEALLCNRFRSLILNQERDLIFHDPSIFTLRAILEYNRDNHPEMFEFVKQCCYLRYDLKFYSKKITLKEKLAKEIFQLHPLPREEIYRLNDFKEFPLLEQLQFGNRVFVVLLDIYKMIASCRKDCVNALTRRDMTIIGRKLAAYLESKNGKVPVVHKPVNNLNHNNLTFSHDGRIWHVHATGEAKKAIVDGVDVIYCIAYLVWNGLFQYANIRMAPNPTSITLQEIDNLAKRIKDIFGEFDISGVDFDNYLEMEKVTKMLVIINFANSGQTLEMSDFSVIYGNHWGELFYRRFISVERFKKFIAANSRMLLQTERFYYIQRSSLYYEKQIERVKKLVNQIFSSIDSCSSMSVKL